VNAFSLSANAGMFDDSAEPAGNRILFGRFMLPDMSEHPCQVGSINADGVVLLTDIPADAGTAIIAYLDDIGRVDGTVTGKQPNGFHIAFNLTGARRERMEKRIEWLQESSPDQRRHDRFKPKETVSQITLADGREYDCEVLDISISGAAIKSHVLPSIGTYVNLGKMRGRVVRYTADGFAIEFIRKMDPSNLKLHAQL
jgi:hypothetical protein